jgi:hypothetical protein
MVNAWLPMVVGGLAWIFLQLLGTSVGAVASEGKAIWNFEHRPSERTLVAQSDAWAFRTTWLIRDLRGADEAWLAIPNARDYFRLPSNARFLYGEVSGAHGLATADTQRNVIEVGMPTGLVTIRRVWVGSVPQSVRSGPDHTSISISAIGCLISYLLCVALVASACYLCRVIRKAFWTARALCSECGYPVSIGRRCPECGRETTDAVI